jgi:hypothetical protein
MVSFCRRWPMSSQCTLDLRRAGALPNKPLQRTGCARR